MEADDTLESVTLAEWLERKQAQGDGSCPCDNHPGEVCETCRGACSCHWVQVGP